MGSGVGLIGAWIIASETTTRSSVPLWPVSVFAGMFAAGLGIIIVDMVKRRRKGGRYTPPKAEGSSERPSTTTIIQGPGAGGPAWGPNARGGQGGDIVNKSVRLEAGTPYPYSVGRGGHDGIDRSDTTFGEIRAKGGKSAQPAPDVSGLPGADGQIIIKYLGP